MANEPAPPKASAPKPETEGVDEHLEKLTRDLDALEKEVFPAKPKIPPVGGMI